MVTSSNKRLAQDALFNKTSRHPECLQLQINAIFHALIFDKNKLSSIHKNTHLKFLSNVLRVLILLVEVNAVGE